MSDEIQKVARLSYGRLAAILAARAGGPNETTDALSEAVLQQAARHLMNLRA